MEELDVYDFGYQIQVRITLKMLLLVHDTWFYLFHTQFAIVNCQNGTCDTHYLDAIVNMYISNNMCYII